MFPKRLRERLETQDLPQECERHHISGNLVRIKMKCVHRQAGITLVPFDLCGKQTSFSTRPYQVCQVSTSFFMNNLYLELAVRNSHYSHKVQSKTHYTVNASIHLSCLYYVPVVTLRLRGNCSHQPNLLKQESCSSFHFRFLLCSSLT